MYLLPSLFTILGKVYLLPMVVTQFTLTLHNPLCCLVYLLWRCPNSFNLHRTKHPDSWSQSKFKSWASSCGWNTFITNTTTMFHLYLLYVFDGMEFNINWLIEIIILILVSQFVNHIGVEIQQHKEGQTICKFPKTCTKECGFWLDSTMAHYFNLGGTVEEEERGWDCGCSTYAPHSFPASPTPSMDDFNTMVHTVHLLHYSIRRRLDLQTLSLTSQLLYKK